MIRVKRTEVDRAESNGGTMDCRQSKDLYVKDKSKIN